MPETGLWASGQQSPACREDCTGGTVVPCLQSPFAGNRQHKGGNPPQVVKCCCPGGPRGSKSTLLKERGQHDSCMGEAKGLCLRGE